MDDQARMSDDLDRAVGGAVGRLLGMNLINCITPCIDDNELTKRHIVS
jgi:hypothetical protein